MRPGYPHDPDHPRYRQAFAAVKEVIERDYRIPVLIGEVVAPNTGDFNGVSITIDREQAGDVALYVVAHLFGHTVQWNTSEAWRTLGIRSSSLDQRLPQEVLEQIGVYERQASEYGMTVFHEAGVRDLDGWLSDWFAADWAYLREAYQLGRRPADFRAFLSGPGDEPAPLLAARPIPPFEPTRWVSRYAF